MSYLGGKRIEPGQPVACSCCSGHPGAVQLKGVIVGRLQPAGWRAEVTTS